MSLINNLTKDDFQLLFSKDINYERAKPSKGGDAKLRVLRFLEAVTAGLPASFKIKNPGQIKIRSRILLLFIGLYELTAPQPVFPLSYNPIFFTPIKEGRP